MKRVSLLLFFQLALIIGTNAESDSSLSKRVTNLEQSIGSVQTSINQINQKLTPTPPPQTSVQILRHLSKSQKVFVVMPVILFLIIFFVLLILLNRGGFSLATALQGDVPIEIEQTNTALADAAKAAALATAPTAVAGATSVPVQINMPANLPSTVTVSQMDQNNNPVLPQSSSRFIALFSGFAAIIIAICLVSYYVYFAIANLKAPDFNNLFEAILGLGIGVVPYAVTKFTQK